MLYFSKYHPGGTINLEARYTDSLKNHKETIYKSKSDYNYPGPAAHLVTHLEL